MQIGKEVDIFLKVIKAYLHLLFSVILTFFLVGLVKSKAGLLNLYI